MEMKINESCSKQRGPLRDLASDLLTVEKPIGRCVRAFLTWYLWATTFSKQAAGQFSGSHSKDVNIKEYDKKWHAAAANYGLLHLIFQHPYPSCFFVMFHPMLQAGYADMITYWCPRQPATPELTELVDGLGRETQQSDSKIPSCVLHFMNSYYPTWMFNPSTPF